ncbi:protein FAM161B-like [Ptychodera flava]|uniref:protein FAM161B-like n=1 Tax=Ptychodera flava TaxID=63121 RepID=UPI003969EB6E
MATGHTLSVITNSYVKNPVNPKTRLAATLDERGASLRSSWKGELGISGEYPDNREVDEVIAVEPPGQTSPRTLNLNSTDRMIECLTDDVANLTDEEFYRRLQTLKREHQKTLSMVERLYSEKIILDESYPSDTIHLADHHKTKHIDEQIDEVNRNIEGLQKSYKLGSHLKDSVRDMSSKPPLPTNTTRPPSAKKAWATSPARRSSPGKLRRSGSYSGEDWRDITWNTSSSLDASANSGNDDDDNASVASAPARERSSSALGVIDDMWDGFSVDEYAPRSRTQPRPRTISRSSSQSSLKKEWSPKITIPKPFSMTLRDAGRVKKKTKAAIELERELLEKQQAEEAECQKKFKASPAPAHTFVPLYDELMEKQEVKRRQNRELSKEMVRSLEKPFNFVKREEGKKAQRRTLSVPLSENKKPTKHFKAKPVPKCVYSPTVSDRMEEEEEYRKIRIKMRAEEMLRQSQLPKNMQVRGKEYTDGKLRHRLIQDRENRAFITREHKFKPNVNNEIPDYDEQYKKFHKKMSKKKYEKEATAVQPFNLRTSRIRTRKDKILQDMEEDEKKLKEQRWPFTSTRSMSPTPRGSINISDDAIPAKMTQAAQLRESMVRKSLEERVEKQKMELEQERIKRFKERKMRKYIAEKARANDQSSSLKSTNREKIKNFKQSERSRQEEYEQELQEMMARIESQPLLFERESQTNAKRQAEKKYQQALKDAGVEEDFILRKSGGKASTVKDYGDSDSDDDDFDDKYNYSDSFSGAASQSASSKDKPSSPVGGDDDDDDDVTVSSIHTEEEEDGAVDE